MRAHGLKWGGSAGADLFKLFKRTLDQYDRLRKRNAFLDAYKREDNFELEEFDDAR
jgi:tubulin gamma